MEQTLQCGSNFGTGRPITADGPNGTRQRGIADGSPPTLPRPTCGRNFPAPTPPPSSPVTRRSPARRSRGCTRSSCERGRGLRDRGRRRQPLPRLQRRHRRRRRRPRPPRGQRRDPRPGRRRPALLLERLLPARLRRPLRAARRLGADAAARRQGRVFLCNSGTEAVEAALKLSRHHTGRPNVIAFLGGFHGRSLGSLSLTASKARQRAGFGVVTPGSFHAPYWDPYDDDALTGADVHRGGAVQEAHRSRRRGRDLRRADPGRGRLHRPAGRLAGRAPRRSAIGTASCSCSTRCSPASGAPARCGRASTLTSVRRRARHHVRSARVSPAACRSPASSPESEIMDWEPGGHGSTFGGNPVACAAAIATHRPRRERARRQRRQGRRPPAVGARRAAGRAAADRAGPRPRPDDRHRPARPRHGRGPAGGAASAAACSRSPAASARCASPRRSSSRSSRPTPPSSILRRRPGDLEAMHR